MIFYFSDLHIGHKAALRFDRRPFADIQEMKHKIVRRWNEKVTATVFFRSLSWAED